VFKKDYWHVEIKGALDNIAGDLERGVKDKEFEDDLLLVSNEFKKQMALTPAFKFAYTDQLTADRITPEVVTAAIGYVESIRKIYVNIYNDASNRKEIVKANLAGGNLRNFLELRNNYHNKTLEEFVKDKNESTKTIVYQGELLQKLDPIFMDSKSKLIKAHFYAPEKQIFGYRVDTYVVNAIILWVMTLFLYLALYFRLLKKILDSGEAFIRRRKRRLD
jgi:hypothetical protein